jgi:hypothetical protein
VRSNRKWTSSERRGELSPAQRRYLEEQRKHLEKKQTPPSTEQPNA